MKWVQRLAIMASVISLAANGLFASNADAPANGMGTYEAAVASPDNCRITTPSVTVTDGSVPWVERVGDRGRVVLQRPISSPVATFTGRTTNFGATYLVTGNWGGGGSGGTGGTTRNDWSSDFYSDNVCSVGLRLDSSLIPIGESTTATVSVVNGMANGRYAITLSSEPTGSLSFGQPPDNGPSVGLDGPTASTTRPVKGEVVGNAKVVATLPGAGNSPTSRPVTVVAVDRVIVNGTSNPEVTGMTYVPVDQDATLRAMPNPSGAGWPGGKPTWTVTKPDNTTVDLGQGPTATTRPSVPGTYVVKAKCGSSEASITLKATSIKVVSLSVTSDHALLTDKNDDFKDGGTKYAKPDWTSDGTKNNPVSHTWDSKMTVDVTIEVLPAGTPAFQYDLAGSGCGDFRSNAVSIAGGTHAVSFTATNKLPKKVDAITSGIDWTVTRGGTTWARKTTGPKTVYVTVGTPSGSAVTEKRLSYVCEKASGCSTIDTSAKAIFDSLPNRFDLSAPVWGPDPIWLLHDATEKSQCPGLAKFVKAHFDMLGLGSGNYAYCHIKKDGTYGDPSTSPALDTRTAADVAPGHDPKHFAVRSEEIGHIDGDGGVNNYECTYKLNSLYYACGVDIFNSPAAVCKGSFVWMGWMFLDATGWNKCEAL